MAALYPVRALWPVPPRDLRSIAVTALAVLGEQPMPVRLVLADGEHGFATPAAATGFLKGAARPVDALAVELCAGFPIQSERGLIGQFGHVAIDLLFHLRTADALRLQDQCRAFGMALIAGAGARAVWFGSAREDDTMVAAAAATLDQALCTGHPADPLPLSLVDHIAWMILWRQGTRTDLAPSLPSADGMTGVVHAASTPWAAEMTD